MSKTMPDGGFEKVTIVTISLQNFMKLAIFNLHMLYFQCVKGIKKCLPLMQSDHK